MFDAGTKDTATPASIGTDIYIEDPITGEPLFDDGKPVTWGLRGEDAPEVRAVIHAQQDRRNDNIGRGRGAALDAKTLESQLVDRLVAATIRYSDNWGLDGELLPFNEVNVRRLLTDKRLPWLPEQLNRELQNRKRFLPKTSKP